MNRMLRRGAAIAAAVLLLVLAAGLVLGKGELLGGKLRTGDTVTVPADETWDGDIYLAGGHVIVEGTVKGDVTAVGGQVDVNGRVTGDVLAAGGTLSVSGSVDGDARLFGGQVNVAGAVAEDVAITGGQITIAGGGSVGGDLISAGGTLTVAGDVAGSIEASAGTYSRSGTVGGSEHVVIQQERATTPATAGEVALDAARHFVAVVLIGALLLWWLPRTVRAADQALRTRPALSLGYGLLAVVGYIGLMIAAVIAMVLLAILLGLLTLGGLVAVDVFGMILGIGVVTFLFVLACSFVADALVGLALARLAGRMEVRNRWQELGLLAAGAALVVIVTTIPVIGGWLKLAVILFGLGALGVAWWEAWRGGRRGASPAPVPPAGPPPAPEAPPAT